jgi:hypothetical protein
MAGVVYCTVCEEVQPRHRGSVSLNKSDSIKNLLTILFIRNSNISLPFAAVCASGCNYSYILESSGTLVLCKQRIGKKRALSLQVRSKKGDMYYNNVGAWAPEAIRAHTNRK